jgi:hypothetical protein
MTTPKELADKAKQQADEHAAQQGRHGTSNYMIVDEGKRRAALHATIDQLQAMAESLEAELNKTILERNDAEHDVEVLEAALKATQKDAQ